MDSIVLNLIFSFLICCSFLEVFCYEYYKRYKNAIYFFCIFTLGLCAGIRENTYDYNAYVMLFQQTPDIFTMLSSGDFSYIMDVREEPGYILLNSFVKCFTDEPEVLFCVVSFSSLLLYGLSIRKYTKYTMLSILLYFSMIYLVKEMVQIRRGLAMAIFIYSFRYVLANEFKKFLLFILLASCFHESIVFSILVYPLRHIHMNYAFGFFMIFCYIILYFLNIVDNFLFPLSEGFEYYARLTSYLNSDFLAMADLKRFAEYSALFFILLLLGKQIREKYKYYNFMMIILSTGLLVTAMWSAYPFFADGLSAPMWISLIFLLPAMLDASNNIAYKYLMAIIIILISLKSFLGNMVMVIN